jgi:hypothetical protein
VVEKIGINRYVIDIAAKADGPLMQTAAPGMKFLGRPKFSRD